MSGSTPGSAVWRSCRTRISSRGVLLTLTALHEFCTIPLFRGTSNALWNIGIYFAPILPSASLLLREAEWVLGPDGLAPHFKPG